MLNVKTHKITLQFAYCSIYDKNVNIGTKWEIFFYRDCLWGVGEDKKDERMGSNVLFHQEMSWPNVAACSDI